ncbi:MAG: hypothetical protein KDE54_07615 [Caldilineaceae bacterium]|nr:hypothetical protein [Caldilineaceae bacterium]MCB0143562.1 hypothetical protein [Caldilineaceae bacterium]
MQPTTHLFTIRVWQEEVARGVFEWRGSVRYGLDGQVAYFAGGDSLDDVALTELITRMIGQRDETTPAQGQAPP